ncbi:hypothetical protein GUITHDRAFT_104898 [Guillardia theta CCMP2712]|uniref:Trafficking protein particle complex subunit 11 domain-containing protein n=1 Tax=Guillardia theta (strain CCMP2712) TaxID=905079 RepID=L1JMA9_GUITC|nr:hypothetical protein GUITHDRAFT_104898 [Guillardia theta CCMP2712]EKX49369.1 hypothetical protein GUITHDRAFT_104898 [Guillardia theta CCMP2712]|eukprot:XP_005836349.1 hypothetical protein GUITHDRAFT_104898 [Guillardia theta CCMP2712]
MPLLRTVDLDSLPSAIGQHKEGGHGVQRASGMLKKQWLRKHVMLRPCAIAILIPWKAADEAGDLHQLKQQVALAEQEVSRPGVRVVLALVVEGATPTDVDQRFELLLHRLEYQRSLAALVIRHPEFALRLSAEKLQHKLMDAAWLLLDEACARARTKLLSFNRQHQLELIVRQGIKLAFYLEHKERSAALKQFLLSYSDVCDGVGHVVMERFGEFKRVAEVLNVKICLLLMQLTSPHDAQQQVFRHINFWNIFQGESLPSHLAWMSRQHFLFAKLLDEAEASDGSSSRIDSGIHWEACARLLLQRKQALKATSDKSGRDDNAVECALFWGQKDQEELKNEEMERRVDLLSEARECFKRAREKYMQQKHPRREVAVQLAMAKSLLESGSMQEAQEELTSLLLGPIVKDRWFVLEQEVLQLQWKLDTSRALGDLELLVATSLKLLEERLQLGLDRRRRLQEDVQLLVSGFPLELPQSSSPPPTKVDLSWANLRAPVLVSLPPSLLCFSLSFSSSTFTVGEQLTFKLELSSALPAPLRLSALVARCTDSNYNFLLSAVEVDDRELQLEEEEQVKHRIRIEHELDLVPGSCWKIDCALPASLPASHLGIRNVTLVWGAPPACILLRTEEGARGRGGQEHAEQRETMVMAAKPDAKVAMVCHPPALLGELFPVALRVLSSSSSQLRAGRLKCRVDMTDVQGRAQVQLFAAKATGRQEGGGSELELELPVVDGGEEHVEVLHLKVVEEEAMPSLDVLQLALRAELQHEGDSGKVSRVEQQVEVEVEKPFLLTVLYGALSHADSLLVHQPTADVTPSSSAPSSSSSSSSFSASPAAASSSPNFVLRGESVIARVILEALSPAALLLEEASLQLGEEELRPLGEEVGLRAEAGGGSKSGEVEPSMVEEERRRG